MRILHWRRFQVAEAALVDNVLHVLWQSSLPQKALPLRDEDRSSKQEHVVTKTDDVRVCTRTLVARADRIREQNFCSTVAVATSINPASDYALLLLDHRTMVNYIVRSVNTSKVRYMRARACQ